MLQPEFEHNGNIPPVLSGSVEDDLDRFISDQTRAEMDDAETEEVANQPLRDELPVIIRYSTSQSSNNYDDYPIQHQPSRLSIEGSIGTVIYEVTRSDYDLEEEQQIHQVAKLSRPNTGLIQNNELRARRSLYPRSFSVGYRGFGRAALGDRSGSIFSMRFRESTLPLEVQISDAEGYLKEIEGRISPKGGVKVAGISVEGGLGTTTLAMLASLIASTKANTYMLDLNPNGVMEYKFRSGTKPLTVKDLSREVFANFNHEGKMNEDARDRLRANIPLDRSNGVRLISAVKSYDVGNRFNDKDVERALDAVGNQSHQFYDVGNNLSDPAVVAALRQSNIFMFTANVTDRESLWQLQASMQTLRNIENGIFRERVDSAVVVFIGLKNREGIDNLAEQYLSQIDANSERTSKLTHRGSIVILPHIESLLNDRRAPIKLETLKPRTKLGNIDLRPYHSYLELAVAILDERIRQIDSGIDYSTAR